MLFSVSFLKSNLIIIAQYIAVESQNIIRLGSSAYIGGANDQANDFPVFCADSYPVDPSIITSVPGDCKECNVALGSYSITPTYYMLEAKVHSGHGAICEDL
jgi:hypothetical protein